MSEQKPKKRLKRSYKDGRKEGNWITWDSKQTDIERGFFRHKSFYMAGTGYESTKAIVDGITKDKVGNRRSDMQSKAKRFMRARKGGAEKLSWEDLQGNFPYNDPAVAAFSMWIGASPVIIWQSPPTGKWFMCTGYGVADGIEVSIHKNFEWRLRQQPLAGWIYWLGPSVIPKAGRSQNKLLEDKVTVWSWRDVRLEIWGKASNEFTTYKGKNLRLGLPLGQTSWIPFSGMRNSIRVGNLLTTGSTMDDYGDWTDWTMNEIRRGRGIGFMRHSRKTGKDFTVIQTGLRHVNLTDKAYQKRVQSVEILAKHTKGGKITYF